MRKTARDVVRPSTDSTGRAYEFIAMPHASAATMPDSDTASAAAKAR